MVEARALEDEENITLLDQRGVPEHEDRGVVTQDTDRLMNMTFLHGS